MRARSIVACVAVWSSFACSSPEPPPPPPVEAIPPPPAALACPPVRVFANDWFYFHDGETGHSCVVYLEQDECMLGIFDDCTTEGSRFWEGEIQVLDAGGDHIELHSAYRTQTNNRPVLNCSGTLLEGERAQLNCDRDGVQLLLERYLPEPATFGDEIDSFRVSQNAMSLIDLQFAEADGKEHLWATANTGDQPGLVGAERTPGGSWRVRQFPDPHPTAFDVLFSPDGRKAVVLEDTGMFLLDVATGNVLDTAVDPAGDFMGVGAAQAGQFVVAYARNEAVESQLQRWSFDPFEVVTVEDPVENFSTREILDWTPGDPIVLAGYRGKRPEFIYEGPNGASINDATTLTERFTTQLAEFAPGAGQSLLPGESRLALAWLSGRLREVQINPDELVDLPYLPMPYFRGATGLAHDAAEDEYFVAGVLDRPPNDPSVEQAAIARFSRTLNRALPGVFITPGNGATKLKMWKGELYAAVGGTIIQIDLTRR